MERVHLRLKAQEAVLVCGYVYWATAVYYYQPSSSNIYTSPYVQLTCWFPKRWSHMEKHQRVRSDRYRCDLVRSLIVTDLVASSCISCYESAAGSGGRKAP